jgi:hypothetical protein
MNRKVLFFALSIIFLLNQSLYGQLGPGGIGSFESNVHGKWKAAPENLDFTNSDSDFFEQSGSLKVISGGEHTLINYDASNFNKQIGQEVNISFYAKSKKGNSISVTIKDGWGNAAEETPQTQTIRSNEWSYYSFKFIPTTASSSGKIKLIFANSGTYHIDALTLENKSTSNLYVSSTAGGGGNGSLASPFNTIQQAVNSWQKGDVIYVRSGTYYNSNHGSGTNNNQVVNLSMAYNNAATAPDIYNPLVIRNYSGEQPKIKFDGMGGFIGGNSGIETSYLEISGFEIEGPNANITYIQAIANRTNFVNQVAGNPNAQPQKKFTGRGIAIWSGHHIILHNNKVYDCPNSGIRVNNGDYVVIAHNQVYNTTWWSFNAESAIVIAQSKHLDDKTYTIKMRITHNRTYDNINKIPYFNKTYMNNGTCNGVTANSSKSDKYGCDVQDYIIDGSGCYITRNNSNGSGANDQNPNGQYKGTFYFANNVSYGNGLNGLVVHKTNNSIVANNTIFENGEIPTNINTTYGVDWKDALNHGRQGTSGITIHSSYNVKVFNNVSWAKQANDNAFQIFSINTQNNPNAVTGSNNVLAFGEVSNTGISFFPNGFYVDKRSEKTDLFKNSAAFDFDLPQSSYLVDNGVQNNNIPLYDINSNIRVNPDIGAYEYPLSSGKQSAAESLTGFENINKNIDDPDFNIIASSNSTGSITYTSSNPNVATVSGNIISIVGPGTTQITLNQTEDDNYEAFSKNITLTVTSGNNGKQSVAESLTGFDNMSKDIYDPDFNLNASSNSSGLITYSSSNPGVAKVSGNTVTIIGLGTTQITFNQLEDNNYYAFSKSVTLTINSVEGSGLKDNDNDGVINQNDANPNDPYSNSNDVNGNRIFFLPNDNFSISIENLSCRGSSDGSIAVSAMDENLNYTLTINGDDTHNLNSSSGYSKSIINLNTGQYTLCFTVEGESGYNQCFDINIAEPAPLSASSRVNNANKSISFDLSGSDKYTIIHNGIEKDFDHSNPKIDLKKGVNFLKVKTDKSCQGSYTEEVFISEEVEFYPNPTKDNVNLYIHGKDSTVDIRVIDGDGNILKTSCNEIHSSRKVQINLEEFSKGIYLIQLSGETVDKTVKIVRE